MRRLLQLWGIHARLNLIWLLRDARAFFLFAVADLVLALAGVTGVLLVAERFHGIGPWSRAQVLFLLGYAALVRGLLDSFFGLNVLFISRRLGRGQLDHVLIQPQPVWQVLLTEGFTPFDGLATVLPGVLLLGMSVARLSLPLTAAWGVLLLVNLLASAVLTLAFSFLIGSLAFWAPRGGEEVSMVALGLVQELKVYPLDGFGRALRTSLVTALPVGFVAWYPCRSLLGLDPAPWGVAATPVAALILSTLALVVFRSGLRHYAHTGSQRYSLFGHRR